jgi:hypothetical protein
MTDITKRQKLFAFLLFHQLLFCLPFGISQAQISHQDRPSVDSLLLTGQDISGLEFVVMADSLALSQVSANSRFHQNIKYPGKWYSDTLGSYVEAKALKEQIPANGLGGARIVYILFKKECNSEVLQDYLDNLIRNELISRQSMDDGGELVLLATKTVFKPFHQIRLRILNDLKMIVLLFSLAMFFVASVLLVVFMFFVKSKKRRTEVMTQRFKNLCYEPLSNLLFEVELEDLKEFSVSKICGYFPSAQFDNTLFKDVMIQEIISLNKNMKGDFKTKLKLIYRKLNLVAHSFKKLESSKWDVVTTGLVEINEMDVIEAAPIVQKFTHHENFHIRSQAVATYLNISNDMTLQVLVHQTYPLSRWQQMTYFRIIRFLSSQGTKVQVERLFESYNESVRIFGYRIVRYLGLVDRLDALLEKYPDAGRDEKIEILRCFDLFSYTEALEHVHKDVYTEDKSLYVAAVKVLQNIGTIISQAILIGRIEHLADFDCLKATVEALKAMNPVLVEKELEPSLNEDIRQVIAHLQDPVLSDV